MIRAQSAWSSLTFRLFFSLTGVIIFSLLLVAGLGLRSANIEISEDYDAQLITESLVIWQLTHDYIQPAENREYDLDNMSPWIKKSDQAILEKYAQWRGFRIWKNGAVILESDNLPDLPKAVTQQGFSNIKTESGKWRVYAMHAPQEDIVVEMFENLHNRKILQDSILAGIVVPTLVILPILALLLYFGIRYGLMHLYVLARRLETRTFNDLSRLDMENAATELKPLVGSINQLLDKLEVSMLNEREFVDHAAHELRTPLSALKLQAQLIAKSLGQTPERQAVDELLLSVNRTSRLVDQLLQLSRLSHQTITLSDINLGEIAKEIIATHATAALDKNMTLAFEGDDQINVRAQRELLGTLIGTILENAIKYTPAGGHVTVITAQQNGTRSLMITDTGPGIPKAEHAQVFQRFYRASDADQPGSGLGLAIAQQIAQSMNIKIELQSVPTGSGLSVKLNFQD